MEQKFWETFCDLIGLDARFRNDAEQEAATKSEVAKQIGAKSAAHWASVFAGKDVCCSIVCSVQDALRDPHFAARGIFARTLRHGGTTIPALPVPIAERFRAPGEGEGYPGLGEANAMFENGSPHSARERGRG